MDEMRAREVLSATGLPGAAELLALGENAVFAADGLVVKVGRDATGHPELAARAEREVAGRGRRDALLLLSAVSWL
ncbi:hypothetical protein I3W98_09960, partial [Streptomyces cavourensis]|nr:hypothetical protein [Streptomyces cavourensis]